MSKKIVAIIVAVVIVAAAAVGVTLAINGYNSGKIGNKAEKIAEEFKTELVGEWNGSYSISKLTFNEDGTMSFTLVGQGINGTYSDVYDLETEIHTLTVKYTAYGVSVTKEYTATINESGELTLKDKSFADSVGFVYRRAESGETAENETAENNTTTTNAQNQVANLDEFKAALLGKWMIEGSTNTGYTFVDSSTVTVTLVGLSYDGTYNVTVDEETGACALQITYARLAGTSVSNTYFANISDDKLTLVQKGAESLGTTYVRAQADNT